MNIIVGASGQVGSAIIRELSHQNLPLRAVVRNAEKLAEKGFETRIADLFDVNQLIHAFDGGTTAFLLTPENPKSNDIIGETKHITDNYKLAIQATGVRRIVGLSSIGAHIKGNTGNLLMSGILEQAFDDLGIEKIFIRPSYYYSNWLGYLETMEQFRVLPTFFPEHLKLDMNSPLDVAAFIADIIRSNTSPADKKIFELVGPQKYSSSEVADTFSFLWSKTIEARPVPKEKQREVLLSAGFTENTSLNLLDMTDTVIQGLAIPEREDKAIKLQTSLYEYLKAHLNHH